MKLSAHKYLFLRVCNATRVVFRITMVSLNVTLLIQRCTAGPRIGSNADVSKCLQHIALCHHSRIKHSPCSAHGRAYYIDLNCGLQTRTGVAIFLRVMTMRKRLIGKASNQTRTTAAAGGEYAVLQSLASPALVGWTSTVI